MVYTPRPGFVGVDSFQYMRCSVNDLALCDEATVAVTVGSPLGQRPPSGPPGSEQGEPGLGGLPVTGPGHPGALTLGALLLLVGAVLCGLTFVPPVTPKVTKHLR
jgi:hypothetical protein